MDEVCGSPKNRELLSFGYKTGKTDLLLDCEDRVPIKIRRDESSVLCILDRRHRGCRSE